MSRPKGVRSSGYRRIVSSVKRWIKPGGYRSERYNSSEKCKERLWCFGNVPIHHYIRGKRLRHHDHHHKTTKLFHTPRSCLVRKGVRFGEYLRNHNRFSETRPNWCTCYLLIERFDGMDWMDQRMDRSDRSMKRRIEWIRHDRLIGSVIRPADQINVTINRSYGVTAEENDQQSDGMIGSIDREDDQRFDGLNRSIDGWIVGSTNWSDRLFDQEIGWQNDRRFRYEMVQADEFMLWPKAKIGELINGTDRRCNAPHIVCGWTYMIDKVKLNMILISFGLMIKSY